MDVTVPMAAAVVSSTSSVISLEMPDVDSDDVDVDDAEHDDDADDSNDDDDDLMPVLLPYNNKCWLAVEFN